MKIDEISTILLPSVFCYDLEFSEIQLDGTKIETIEVDMDVAEVTIKGVMRTRYGMIVKVGIVLVADDKAAVTRTARAAKVIINDKSFKTNFGLVSDIVEVNNLEVIHHSLEQLAKVG